MIHYFSLRLKASLPPLMSLSLSLSFLLPFTAFSPSLSFSSPPPSSVLRSLSVSILPVYPPLPCIQLIYPPLFLPSMLSLFSNISSRSLNHLPSLRSFRFSTPRIFRASIFEIILLLFSSYPTYSPISSPLVTPSFLQLLLCALSPSVFPTPPVFLSLSLRYPFVSGFFNSLFYHLPGHVHPFKSISVHFRLSVSFSICNTVGSLPHISLSDFLFVLHPFLTIPLVYLFT